MAQIDLNDARTSSTCPKGGKEMKAVTEPEKLLSPFGAVVFAGAGYMKSQRAAGSWAAESNCETVTVGFSHGFGGQPDTQGRNMPLIPVANNSTFMVDHGYHGEN